MLLTLILQTALLAQVSPVLTPPAAAPATQPAPRLVEQAQDETARRSLVDEMYKTQLGQIMRGEKELTWSEIKKPTFWLDTIRNLVDTLLAFIPRFIGTMVFLFAFWLFYRGIRKVVVGNLKKSDVDSSIRDLMATIIKWFVMGFGVVIACNQLGIPIVAMLTGVSIIGLAVGFAAQETLANFIAGIVIFLDKPFKVGDWITIDSVFSRVRRISFRSTRLLTEDGEIVVFPNTYMLANRVTNHTDNAMNRVSVEIGISYRASIDDARRVLLALCQNDSRIASHPAPEVIVTECAASSVNLKLRFWIEDEALERRIRYEYLEKAKNALDRAGIAIPFPHMQLLLEETPALKALTGKAA